MKEKKKSYFGSKNGSGSFQQIINEIPPIKRIIIGFLGNCPLFKYFADQIDTIGYERSMKVVRDYWYNYQNGKIFVKDFLPELPKIFSSTQSLDDLRTSKKFPSTPSDKDTFIYLDPPYLLNSRKKQAKVYEFELTEEDHIYLLDQIQDRPSKIAISCYDNLLYQEKLKGWRKKRWTVTTRSGKAVETLYMNYPTPEKLFTYDFLGKNNTDRQRIKRKILRIQKRLQQLPPREMNAILSTLQNL